MELLAADDNWNPIIFLGPVLFVLLLIVFVWLLPAVVAALIAENKGRNGVGWFFATFFFLGPFGVGFALIAPHGAMDPLVLPTPAPEVKRKAAPGRQRFVCPRCGAENDIPEADSSYDCWRCNEHRNVKPKVAPAKKR
ncbi:hypothetical protein [Mycobacterium sp. URHB0044]|uniref:hypothetical protein n=1 Tax=Mycobacterium sp. URHB0044 TaxID=1380386 RepID=UPI00048DBD19|nr:hypothetical protein [Mycobacterium sp. URHB0044]